MIATYSSQNQNKAETQEQKSYGRSEYLNYINASILKLYTITYNSNKETEHLFEIFETEL